jgi:small subunit ribosomal protein S3Ae
VKMAKKISSWKQKKIYTLTAPENFDFRELGNTLSNNPKNLIGRTIDVSLRDLTGDKTKQHLKIVFEICDVKDNKAHTRFKVFDVNPGYLRSKVRKGSSKIDYIHRFDIEPNLRVQVKVDTVTHQNIKTSRGKEMTAKITEILDRYKNTKLDDFIQATLFGKLGTEIYREIKKIAPVRRVEIEQVKVV